MILAQALQVVTFVVHKDRFNVDEIRNRYLYYNILYNLNSTYIFLGLRLLHLAPTSRRLSAALFHFFQFHWVIVLYILCHIFFYRKIFLQTPTRKMVEENVVLIRFVLVNTVRFNTTFIYCRTLFPWAESTEFNNTYLNKKTFCIKTPAGFRIKKSEYRQKNAEHSS